MNLNQLKMFESVARHLSVTRAAEELHVSQPAISQQLKLLEEQHGARFFLRRGQRLELSEQVYARDGRRVHEGRRVLGPGGNFRVLPCWS